MLVVDTSGGNDPHGADVWNIMTKRYPKSKVQYLEDPAINYSFKITSLDGVIKTNMLSVLRNASENLKLVLRDRDQNLDIINWSWGFTQIQILDVIYLHMDSNRAFAQHVYDTLGVSPFISTPDLTQILMDRMDQIQRHDGQVKKAFQDYQRLTKAIQEKGIILVVPSHNQGRLLQRIRSQGVEVNSGVALNLLAQSPYVVRVGAVDNRGTSTFNDDRIAVFSSPGTQQHPITVVANGVAVDGFSSNKGTSFAAPQVAALAGRIKLVNPQLNPAQVTFIMQKTAYNNPFISTWSEGAGTIRPAKALKTAKATLGQQK